MDGGLRARLRGAGVVHAVLVLVMIMVLMAGCGGSTMPPAATPEPDSEPVGEVVLTGADNGRAVALEQGQVLLISLASNPTTGHTWEVVAVDEAILRQEAEAEYVASDTAQTPVAGAGGTETFRFRAEGSGETELRLVYRRPWEEGVEPAETFAVRASVQ
jgi:inhibitor of cysteine peptidase